VSKDAHKETGTTFGVTTKGDFEGELLEKGAGKITLSSATERNWKNRFRK